MARSKFLQQSDRDIPFILLAEDDDNDAFAMELAFQKAGLGRRVWRVCDVAEAIDYMCGHGKYRDRAEYPPPSLLLVDLKMPGYDGFDLLRWVRSDPQWKNLVAVVLSNSRSPGDVEKAYGLGANSFLVKPAEFLGIADMLKLLERYWSMNQALPLPRRSKQSWI